MEGEVVEVNTHPMHAHTASNQASEQAVRPCDRSAEPRGQPAVPGRHASAQTPISIAGPPRPHTAAAFPHVSVMCPWLRGKRGLVGTPAG
jgi:hypothetical protein